MGQSTHSKLADDTTPGGEADTPHGCAVIQRDLTGTGEVGQEGVHEAQARGVAR